MADDTDEQIADAVRFLQGGVAIVHFWGHLRGRGGVKAVPARVAVLDPKDGVWRDAPTLAGAVEKLQAAMKKGDST